MDTRIGAAIWLRSWLYLVAFLSWTTACCVAFLPCLLRRSWTLVGIKLWVDGIATLGRVVAGIDCRIEGRENLPPGPCIVACQHQTSYETYRLVSELHKPVLVLKRELVLIPFIGWYMRRAGLIGINRRAGAAAMRKTLRGAQAAIDAGRQILIFPQGTRTPRGVLVRYRPGVAALYLHCDVPVIPAALNSDYCWGKSRILKRPGVITIRFLPALPSGLRKDEMLSLLEERIEEASRLLPDPPG